MHSKAQSAAKALIGEIEKDILTNWLEVRGGDSHARAVACGLLSYILWLNLHWDCSSEIWEGTSQRFERSLLSNLRLLILSALICSCRIFTRTNTLPRPGEGMLAVIWHGYGFGVVQGSWNIKASALKAVCASHCSGLKPRSLGNFQSLPPDKTTC